MNPRSGAYPGNAGIETHLTNRAMRSLALFGAAAPISRDDFLRFKWDRAYAKEAPIFEELVAPILGGFQPASDEERRAVEILRAWDGRTDERSPSLPVAAWRYLASDGQVPPEEKTRDAAVALRKALKLLGRADVRLAEMQRLRRGRIELPLGGGPDVLNAVYTHERDGKLVAYQGDSYVLVVEFGAGGVQSSSIHQYGSSNRSASPHHADQAPLFIARKLKKAWRDEAEIRANLERAYHPGEAPKP